jgi:hypothetical protein
MFTANSRYINQPTAEAEAKNGKKVTVITLRRLPYTGGNLVEVQGHDRLDVMAYRKYKDGTKFWHVADANTELEANDLVKTEPSENPLAKREVRLILVPEN